MIYNFYYIKNKLNGKYYIGRTIQEVRKRISSHISSSQCDPALYYTPLYCSFRKFGFKNFSYGIIGSLKCRSVQHANKIEKRLIIRFRAFYPTGYNVAGLSGESLSCYTKYFRNKVWGISG